MSALTSDVSQGTVLGPLLFLIYITDMLSTVSSTIALFADDACIYRSIRKIDDRKTLQEVLQKLIQWEKSWLMEFHPGKCPENYKQEESNQILLLIAPCHLEEVFNAKYLGVTMNIRLSWKKRVHEIFGKANQTR